MPRLGAGASSRRSMSEPAATREGRRLRVSDRYRDCWLPSSSATLPSSGSPAPFGLALVFGLLGAGRSPAGGSPRARHAPARRRRPGDDRPRALGDPSDTSLRCRTQCPCGPQTERRRPPGRFACEAGSPVLIEVPITAERYGRFVIGPAPTNVPGLFGLLNRTGIGGGTLELDGAAEGRGVCGRWCGHARSAPPQATGSRAGPATASSSPR